jgi:hypothetical protein
MTPEFRQGENPHDSKLTCTECGGVAEGEHSWTDGSGEICNACVAADDMVVMADGQACRF